MVAHNNTSVTVVIFSVLFPPREPDIFFIIITIAKQCKNTHYSLNVGIANQFELLLNCYDPRYAHVLMNCFDLYFK